MRFISGRREGGFFYKWEERIYFNIQVQKSKCIFLKDFSDFVNVRVILREYLLRSILKQEFYRNLDIEVNKICLRYWICRRFLSILIDILLIVKIMWVFVEVVIGLWSRKVVSLLYCYIFLFYSVICWGRVQRVGFCFLD